MKNYILHSFDELDVVLPGKNIVDAIDRNFAVIAREVTLDRTKYQLVKVTSTYQPSILSGKGGVEVTIESLGQPLCHNQSTRLYVTKVAWIYARRKDLPSPHQHQINF